MAVSNDKIYTLVNSTRLELKSDIGDVSRKLETLETGRLAILEEKVSKFELDQTKRDGLAAKNQAVLSTKVLILFAIGNILLIGIAQAIAERIIKK